jgi:hypothetical protein
MPIARRASVGGRLANTNHPAGLAIGVHNLYGWGHHPFVSLIAASGQPSYSHGLQLNGPALQSKGPVPPAEGTF